MPEAKIRVTLDIFSGRENPVVEFKGKKLADVVKRLATVGKMDRKEVGLPPMPTLGYRGMIIDQVGNPLKNLPRAFRVVDGKALGRELAFGIKDEAFEEFVCGSVPKKPPIFPLEDILEDIKRFRGVIDFFNSIELADHHRFEMVKQVCKCAPIYEPTWWNVQSRQPRNNCYNYATNYRTDTFAQPGRAAGAQYTSLTCGPVKAAAIKDELIDDPGANNKCPDEGHLVALVIWPNVDYHWYRKGRDTFWSHKPGGTAVTNLDNNNNPILDPRYAERGGYTEFCTFMLVKHGHIKIS